VDEDRSGQRLGDEALLGIEAIEHVCGHGGIVSAGSDRPIASIGLSGTRFESCEPDRWPLPHGSAGW
jgi:hypothetical protein